MILPTWLLRSFASLNTEKRERFFFFFKERNAISYSSKQRAHKYHNAIKTTQIKNMYPMKKNNNKKENKHTSNKEHQGPPSYLKWSERINLFWQTGHTKFFSPVWVLVCRASSSLRANLFLQDAHVHSNGRSPVGGRKSIKIMWRREKRRIKIIEKIMKERFFFCERGIIFSYIFLWESEGGRGRLWEIQFGDDDDGTDKGSTKIWYGFWK